MSDHLSFPPPTGPRIEEPSAESLVPPSTAQVPTSSSDGIWTAPTAPTAGRKPVAAVARATTAESLALAIPELTGSVELDVPGAAASVALTGLDAVTTKVLVNGRRVKPKGFNSVSIPMADGTSRKLRIGGFPGYPVIKAGGKVIYRHPKPPAWEFGLLFLTLAAPIFGLLGGIIPILIGFGSAYLHVLLIKRGATIWVRVLLPLIVAGAWIALGITLLDRIL
jgi:hypothetical protein